MEKEVEVEEEVIHSYSNYFKGLPSSNSNFLKELPHSYPKKDEVQIKFPTPSKYSIVRT